MKSPIEIIHVSGGVEDGKHEKGRKMWEEEKRLEKPKVEDKKEKFRPPFTMILDCDQFIQHSSADIILYSLKEYSCAHLHKISTFDSLLWSLINRMNSSPVVGILFGVSFMAEAKR